MNLGFSIFNIIVLSKFLMFSDTSGEGNYKNSDETRLKLYPIFTSMLFNVVGDKLLLQS